MSTVGQDYNAGPYPSPDPEVGEVFIMGKDKPTAQALLAAARDLGMDTNVVRTVNLGFIVPDAVWDHAQATRNPDQEV